MSGLQGCKGCVTGDGEEMTENGSVGKDSLTIRDNRTGREYEVDIHEGDVVRAMDLRQIKVDDTDFGMMSYDPGFKNTASTRSTITDIDGGKGILRYRGYPIEQLAEGSTFLEVAYLLLNGELPTQSELDEFVQEITYHTNVHENIRTVMNGFRYDAHAMSMLISSVAALGTFYPPAPSGPPACESREQALVHGQLSQYAVPHRGG
jgi:citrate synthase